MNRKLKVFLCHSSNDKPAVRELYKRLKSEGWIDPWLDEEKLYPGQDWDREIEIAVEESESVLILLSKESVEKESYVQYELRSILHIAKYKPAGVIFVLPLRINDCAVPRSLRMWQHIDYFPENRKDWAYQRILGSLKMRAAKLGISTINSAEEKERIEKREQEKSEQEALEEARKEREAEEKARKIAAEKARKEKEEREKKAKVGKVHSERLTRRERRLAEKREKEAMLRKERQQERAGSIDKFFVGMGKFPFSIIVFGMVAILFFIFYLIVKAAVPTPTLRVTETKPVVTVPTHTEAVRTATPTATPNIAATGTVAAALTQVSEILYTLTPTLTPEPTPLYALIASSSGGGAYLRREPGGPVILTLDNNELVQALTPPRIMMASPGCR